MKTCHRELVDRFLTRHREWMRGDVLDIGGKRDQKRGDFRPPESGVSSWKYLNTDADTAPDYCCSADDVPLPDDVVDTFLLCEVVEHLEHPEAVLAEARRVLKPGGTGIITVPFLYPVHADPHDYQRWTDTKLRRTLTGLGFEVVELSNLGGTYAVVLDLLQARLSDVVVRNPTLARAGRALVRIARALRGSRVWEGHARITTGYGLIVRKPAAGKICPDDG